MAKDTTMEKIAKKAEDAIWGTICAYFESLVILGDYSPEEMEEALIEGVQNSFSLYKEKAFGFLNSHPEELERIAEFKRLYGKKK